MRKPCCAATYSRGNVESRSQGYGCGEEVETPRRVPYKKCMAQLKLLNIINFDIVLRRTRRWRRHARGAAQRTRRITCITCCAACRACWPSTSSASECAPAISQILAQCYSPGLRVGAKCRTVDGKDRLPTGIASRHWLSEHSSSGKGKSFIPKPHVDPVAAQLTLVLLQSRRAAAHAGADESGRVAALPQDARAHRGAPVAAAGARYRRRHLPAAAAAPQAVAAVAGLLR